MLKPAVVATTLGVVALAHATWVTIPLRQTPFDAGRYIVSTSHVPLAHGGMHYDIVLRLKGEQWPMRLLPSLTKVVVAHHSLDSYTKRGLQFVSKGKTRSISFDVTRGQVAAWHFQLDEYGESMAQLMPSVKSMLFPLNRAPR